MQIVIDTNVIISAALSPQGNPAKIMNLVTDNDYIELYCNQTIFAEYKKVLSYKRLNISSEVQEEILDMITEIGTVIDPSPSDIEMPDESDRIFYDTAKASGAILITGNKKDYPDEPFILTPSEFVERFENDTL